MRRRTPRVDDPSVELATCTEIDTRFRLATGTTIRACRAGMVKCRPCIARGGVASFKVDIADARRVWGAQ